MMQAIAAKEKKTASQLQAKAATAGFVIAGMGFHLVFGMLTSFSSVSRFSSFRLIGAMVVGGIGAAIGSQIGKPAVRKQPGAQPK